ncbi:FtsK/SpoIIIE domain-containing protein [Thioalkalivibrio sp. ALE12]|uniref:FtsK/SpoIIIE domain-containing protein n=1 Tax=Thioalkalivibrio sp. ALE12 TaxID=1158170 RepID=UPI0003A18EB7|nr:FtsK/SpoIIIE domain-containing protein [Thioalkalivibrio sp. ALE12]
MTNTASSNTTPETSTSIEPLALMARVARRQVQAAVDHHPGERVLFSVIGLSQQQICAIALEIDKAISSAEVHIHHALNDGNLPTRLLSDKTSTYWRNASKPDGAGAVVFAVPEGERETTGASIANIATLDTTTLIEQPALWLEACHQALGEDERQRLTDALTGLTRTDLIFDVDFFARFVARTLEHLEEVPVERALDRALPALRLPRDAGRFKKPQSRPLSAAKWASEFVRVERETRDKLYLRDVKGAPLDRSLLRARVEDLTKDGKIDADVASVARDFLQDDGIAAGQWQPSQARLVDCSWNEVEKLFADSKPRQQKKPLGEDTREFFDHWYPEAISTEDRQVLDETNERKQEPSAEEQAFFFDHRETLRKESRTLYTRWERYIFRQPIERREIFPGLLLALRSALQLMSEAPANPVAYVFLAGSHAPAFWSTTKHTALCRYLRDTLRGLPELAGPEVIVDLGVCWRPEVQEKMERVEVTNVNAQTTEFKFEVYLLERDDLDAKNRPTREVLRHAPKGQFHWTMPAESLPAQMPSDLRNLLPDSSKPAWLLTSTISRNPRPDQRRTANMTLADRNSLLDAGGSSEGQLANPLKADHDVASRIRETLSRFEADHVVSATAAESVRGALEAFEVAYTQAIAAMIASDGRGLADPALLEQASRYGELLETLRKEVRAEAARPHLWESALSIGVAFSSDGPPGAVVTAWHPLRLAELAAKARQFAELCRDLLGRDLTDIATRGGYFDERASALGHLHYPGAVGHSRFSAAVLAGEEMLGGYTIMEPQTVEQGAETLFDAEPKEAANAFVGVCDEQLELKPHEQANFSCVLFNAESQGLPGALSEQLARRIDAEPRLRCELTLTHDDPARLRSIYAEQNAQIGREVDSALSSEGAKSFLSRLRVGFNDLEAVRENDSLAYAADLVLMQDVLARHARTSWRKAQPANPSVALSTFDPNTISKRCPRDPKRRSSATYLTPPRLPRPCQAYIDLLHDYLVNDETDGGFSWLPVREVSFDDEAVTRALESSHQIGEWVVNYDAIADRHLLEANASDIRIIRHLSGPGRHHNLIVSAKDPGRQLRQRLDEQLQRLLPGFDVEGRKGLVDRLLDEASQISGQIVMRAARFERNTLELIGIALSKPLIRELLGRNEPALAWFFLDDVGPWLGHSAGRVADILALSPCVEDGERKLDLVIAESKFVAAAHQTEQLHKSNRQLLETVQGFVNRFCSQEGQVDEPMWRGRLADMMLEHLKAFGDNNPQTLASWADDLREGRLEIRIRGRSYTFVHDLAPPAEVECEEVRPGEVQLLLPREAIAELLRREAGADRAAKASPEPSGVARFAATSGVRVRPDSPTAVDETVDNAHGQQDGDGASEAHAQKEGERADSRRINSTFAQVESDSEDGRSRHQASDEGGVFPAPVRALLSENESREGSAEAEQWLAQTVEGLRIGLREYAMDCKVLEARLTPNAALVHLQGSSRLTPTQIQRKQDELLVSHGLEIAQILKAPGRVSVMIKRPEREFPTIREVWSRRRLPNGAPQSNANILLGVREDTGEALYLNLAGEFAGQEEHAPHTLIAGMTGGGKGVLVQNLLLDICATNAPNAARIWIIDPKKGLDYRWIEGMPHLAGDMALDQNSASNTLTALVEEMNRRNALFRDTRGAPQKLDEYNELVPASERLPRLYVFHDEFAFWGQDKDYRQLAEQQINGLGQMARAAGIHIFLITQRPDRDVMPLQARENLGNRLALRVANENNASLIGVPGAEKLLPKGQLAASLPGEPNVIYAQVPYISREDLCALSKAIRNYWNT